MLDMGSMTGGYGGNVSKLKNIHYHVPIDMFEHITYACEIVNSRKQA